MGLVKGDTWRLVCSSFERTYFNHWVMSRMDMDLVADARNPVKR